MPERLPFMKVFTADWIKETRVLSAEARGIFMDLRTLMHDSPHRGYLVRADEQPYTVEELRAYCSCPARKVAKALDDLKAAGLLEQAGEGVLFYRPMVAEENKRRLCSSAGRKGGGNPSLTFKGQVAETFKGGAATAFKGEEVSTFKHPLECGSVDSSLLPGVRGGAGEAGDTGGEVFELTPEGIANAWCFYLARRKLGVPRDLPMDAAAEFAEMIRLGFKPPDLLAEVENPKRDRGEQLWQFKARLTGGGTKKGWTGPPVRAKSAEERAQEVERQRRQEEAAKGAALTGEEIRERLRGKRGTNGKAEGGS